MLCYNKYTNSHFTKYVSSINNLKISYVKKHDALMIKGRLISSNRVQNLDDITATELEEIINNTNLKLSMLTGADLDIRTFTPVKIEVCFNLSTSYTAKYLEVFNLIFKVKNDSRYTNHIIEQKLSPKTSYYVKTKSQYRDNAKQNFTVNFYHKENQLKNLKKNPKNQWQKEITDRDIALAKNILRLEVKCHYVFQRKLFKTKDDFDFREFNSFLNIGFCGDIVKDKYKYFIDKYLYCDFYSYKQAKAKIINSDIEDNQKNGLLRYIKEISQYHIISEPTHRKYRKLLAYLEIHWCILPKSLKVDFLISPMKLLDEKICA
jgi:hypothetical protein